MRKIVITNLIVLTAVFYLSCASAPPKPSMPYFVSPENVSEGNVIFRYWAPDAMQVQLRLQNRSHQMNQDSEGVWSVSLSLGPGTYEYQFLVDAVKKIDQVNKEYIKDGSQYLSVISIR